ncbi:MAG: LysR family transcriptional regulator [Eubacteriales bacterium]
MNLLYLKYAVEVAACGSINKAAEKLYLGQPNLSRAIKELEASLGVSIFERSSKGMEVTADGEVFLRYAKAILKQVDELDEVFRNNVHKKRFSVSVPRADYIAEAFSNFTSVLDDIEDTEVLYEETNAMRTVQNLLQDDFKLGILRYAVAYDRYYKTMLEEKDLNYELVMDFQLVVLMSENCPLAKKEQIDHTDLRDYIEIAHSDFYVPSLPFAEVKKEELPEDVHRRIFVYERASALELLSENAATFMWVSPVPEKTLERYHLVARACSDNRRLYKDVMIYRKNYRLTELDKLFISELCRTKRQVFP